MKSIKVKSRLEELDNINSFIKDVVKHDDKKLKLIIEEVFINIISYSRAEYVILNTEYNQTENILSIEFVDNGVEFNPFKKEDYKIPDSVKEAQIGGLGIHLIKKFTDSMEYEYDGENHLKITKKVE